ncbi:Uncharacterised protein g8523 [Pycnogonum litorale]
MFCLVAKVGSTTFSSDFLSLQYRVNVTWLKTVNELRGQLIRHSLDYFNETQNDGYFKVMFVRHPFERIVSAYNDKFSICGRPDPSKRLNMHYCSLVRNMKDNRMSIKRNATGNSTLEFDEFIEYIISTNPNMFDIHWRRYKDHCDPCRLRYDLIGKMDTMTDDRRYMYHQSKIQAIKDIDKRANNLRSSRKVHEYFSQLTKRQVIQLYVLYKPDFDYFDYSFIDYYRMAKDY